MYRVVLIDDENIIVEGLRRVIKWADYGCEVVGTASGAEEGAALVGTDAPSVDPAESELLVSHRIALANRMTILENLDLSDVPGGEYELIALPLPLKGVEASPVRAILRSLSSRI